MTPAGPVRPVRAAGDHRGAGGVRDGAGLDRDHRLHAADPAVDRRAAHGHGARQLRADRHPAVRAGRPPAQPRRHRRPHLRVRRGAGRPHPRRAGACQRRGEHDLRRHERRRAGRCRRPGRGRGERDAQGRLRSGLRRGRERGLGHHRPDHPALGDHGRVCGAGAGLGGRPVPGRLPARHPDGRRADGDDLLAGQHRARGRAADAADVVSAPGPHLRACAAGTGGADPAHRRPARRRGHADRAGRADGGLRRGPGLPAARADDRRPDRRHARNPRHLRRAVSSSSPARCPSAGSSPPRRRR